MCFSIPVRVEKVSGSTAVIEGGQKIKIHRLERVKPGDYLRLTGNLATDKISKEDALKIRRLIKKLN